MNAPPWDPFQVAADVEAKRRAGRLLEARDALHAALPWAPNDPAICHAGGELYAQLGYAREAMRFYEVVERSAHPTLARDATAKLSRLAAEGTEGSKDVAVCVLTLGEVYRTAMTAYARAWPYAHWEAATLADPCWVLNPTHLEGAIPGGHAAPPGHRFAWWTVRYAIEALDATAISASLGARFSTGDVLVFLETPAHGLAFDEPTDAHRLGTTTIRRATAIERASEPVDARRITRVYVAGRVEA